jgi:hypothetical protein
MRVRKYHKNTGAPPVERPEKISQQDPEIKEPVVEKTPAAPPAKISQKNTSPRGPAALFRKVMQNPNLNIQLMVIILSLASDNFSMDRRIDSMSSTVDKIRNMTDVISNTMQSVKVAADAPKQIRRLFEVNKE